MFPSSCRLIVLAVLCALTFASDPACADEKQPAQPDPKMPAPKMPGAVQPAVPTPKPAEGLRVHFKDAEWAFVFDYYGKQFGLKGGVKVKPKGLFNFTPPRERTFTFGEITDVINESLIQQKLLLIPYQKTFVVISIEKIDPKFIPAVELKDLAKLPRTAIVEAAFPLEVPGVTAEEAADELKKLLTPFGEIVYAKGKWVIVRDTVGNINRILATLEAVRNAPDCTDPPRPKPQPRPSVPRFVLADNPDEKPDEKAVRKPGVLRVPGADASEVASFLKKLMLPEILIVYVPFVDWILVNATDEELAEIREAFTAR